MKTKLFIALLVLGSIGAHSQNQIEYSFFTSSIFNQGIEIRSKFERSWYIGMQGERFVKENETFINWGFSIGLVKKKNEFDFIAGIKTGLLHFKEKTSPLYGVETEIDYHLSKLVFIGVRYSHEQYSDSTLQEIKSDQLNRVFFKTGIKF